MRQRLYSIAWFESTSRIIFLIAVFQTLCIVGSQTTTVITLNPAILTTVGPSSTATPSTLSGYTPVSVGEDADLNGGQSKFKLLILEELSAGEIVGIIFGCGLVLTACIICYRWTQRTKSTENDNSGNAV